MTRSLRMSIDEYERLRKKGIPTPHVAIVTKSKYGNVKTEVDGITFDSKREAQRFTILKLRMAAGEIRGLTLQERFPLTVNDQLVCEYIADFCYFEGDTRIVEDCKGHRTKDYIIKRKLMVAVYGLTVREV